MPAWLIYGANGYTGGILAREAACRGLRPILAGRNGPAVSVLAAELGLDHRVFNLDDPAALARGIEDPAVVLHCAGPFSRTAKPMADACLHAGVHYLDITGEIPVYEALAARDSDAKARGVMLLPGVGFDVVPTDCLAAYLKRRLPSATRLSLAFHSIGPAQLPPGTANTFVEMVPYGTKVRRNGRLESAPRV